jgi:cysteine desulfurase
MKVYLDNAATTRPFESVINIMNVVNNDDYGNPSSMHIKGYEAEKYIKASRDIISKILKVDSKEIYFTSGGSESDNWAVKGIAGELKHQSRHIITSKIEHHAILHSCEHLEELGYRVSYLDVDKDGIVDIFDSFRNEEIAMDSATNKGEIAATQKEIVTDKSLKKELDRINISYDEIVGKIFIQKEDLQKLKDTIDKEILDNLKFIEKDDTIQIIIK